MPELSTEVRRVFEGRLAANPPSPYLRRRIAAAVAVKAASPPPRRRRSMPRELAVAAALIAFVGLLAGAGAWLRSQSNPARQVTPSRTPVPTQQVLQPKAAAGRQCSSPCVSRTLDFATAKIGWMSDGSGPGGPAFLYRTDDAGQHWQPVLSWDGPGAQQIRSSADGREALIVTGRGSQPATLFHSSDGGAHWTASGLPIGASSDSIIYFLNPQEGWVSSADHYLVHTADSGRHWTRIARLDKAIPPPNAAYYWQRGLGFLDPSFGWYVTYAPESQTSYVSLTHDGGATWRGQALAPPDGLPATTTVTGVMSRFFDQRQGVVDATYGTHATTCSSSDPCYFDYVYLTSDGGAHWSSPVRIPGARTIFLDVNHWFGIAGDIMFATNLVYTSDAGRHWSFLLNPSSPTPAGAPTGAGALLYWDIGNPIDFIDSSHGWAISGQFTLNGGTLSRPTLSRPRLLVTNDGGKSWAIASTVPGDGWSLNP